MIYVTSDLHGFSLGKFKEFLDGIGFGDEDFLYVLGDVIDRGTDGIKILRWLMSKNNAQLIMGNHEAMLLACDFLFDEIGVNRIESRHDPRNPNSGKVMKKCGMKYEGTLHSSDWNNQGICDACYYALLKDER